MILKCLFDNLFCSTDHLQEKKTSFFSPKDLKKEIFVVFSSYESQKCLLLVPVNTKFKRKLKIESKQF